MEGESQAVWEGWHVAVATITPCCSMISSFIYFKTYANEIYFCSSHHIEHNGENRFLNGNYMSQINYFKVLLLCEIM
jgi:hypothetical protein